MITLLCLLALTHPATVESQYKSYVSFLASDELEGRETGERGQKIAAAYLASQLAEAGVAPSNDDPAKPYFQEFELETVQLKPGNATLEGEGNTITWVNHEDFGVWSRGSVVGDLTASLTFVGYGISDPAYQDYQDADVKDRWAVVQGGDPKVGKRKLPGSALETWPRISALRKAGALGVIFLTEDTDLKEDGEDEVEMRLPATEHDPFRPVVRVLPKHRKVLFGKSYAAYEKALKKIEGKGKPASFRIGDQKFSLQVETKVGRVSTENVVGIIPGTDPVLKDEYFVLSAHYDHEGIKNGVVYNGADDNASGTATLILAARALAEKPLKRSVIVLFLTGEEKGLLGSQYFVKSPVVMLSQIVGDVNVDMIGRSADGRFGIIPATMEQTTLSDQAEAVNKDGKYDMTFRYDLDRYHTRSDHYNFTKAGVPAIFFFTDVHEDYHQPTDDWQKLQYEEMAKFYRFFEGFVRRVGDAPEKPQFKKAS